MSDQLLASAEQETPSSSSLEEVVKSILSAHGFSSLPPDEQQRLLPHFTEQALIRLGSAIAPHLSPEGLERFMILTSEDEAGANEWTDFWHSHVPNFQVIFKTALEQYAVEVGVLVGS